MGLIRGVARTAVVAGTATAVSGRVQRRQAERFAARDARIYADRDQAYAQAYGASPYGAPPNDYPEAARPPDRSELIRQLKTLGELHQEGVLTDEEFAAQKAAILG